MKKKKKIYLVNVGKCSNVTKLQNLKKFDKIEKLNKFNKVNNILKCKLKLSLFQINTFYTYFI